MKIPFYSLVFCGLWLLGGMTVGAYLELQEEVAYIKSERQAQRVLKTEHAAVSAPMRSNEYPGGRYASTPTEWNGADWIARFFSALATVTAILVFFESRDKARKELRAFLGIGGGEVYVLPGGRLRAVVEIKNFGKTPALSVQPAITGQLRAPNETKPFGEPSSIPHVQPIAPTMGWTFGHEFLGMTEADLSDVLHDKRLVYIWGFATYKDIYGANHVLRFRFRNVVKVFEANAEGQIVIKKWKYYPEEKGNEAD